METTTIHPRRLERLRVDSSGWNGKRCPDGRRYLENPLGDAWEILDGKFAGEQYFAWWAACREAVATGKRLPTLDDLEALRAALPAGGRNGRLLS